MLMEKNKTEVVQRYVDLLSNSGFKAVFGDRNNKDVVMSVINMLLPEGKRVEEIEYALLSIRGSRKRTRSSGMISCAVELMAHSSLLRCRAIRKSFGSRGV